MAKRGRSDRALTHEAYFPLGNLEVVDDLYWSENTLVLEALDPQGTIHVRASYVFCT